MEISVIIPTYNPNLSRLYQTLEGLRAQTLALEFWELIIVDNNSANHFAAQIDLKWHPQARVVTETKQGLTYARLKGFALAGAPLMVMVDDDNILSPGYLNHTLTIFKDHPNLGAAGGKSLPLFEAAPPVWLPQFYGNLALRNLGETTIIKCWENNYPASAPIGAGMAIRKKALTQYIQKNARNNNAVTDRTGTSLASGGDNDMVIEILKSGWQVGYFPQLSLQHIIPAGRMQVNYLARLLADTNKSWGQLLTKHQINPWHKLTKTGAAMRKAKAFFTGKAWRGKANYIRWRGTCGMYNGQVE